VLLQQAAKFILKRCAKIMQGREVDLTHIEYLKTYMEDED
jgi:hypothetical protein